MKTYDVTVDMTWAYSRIVKAKNANEAKQKVWAKFRLMQKVLKKNFNITAYRLD